MQPAASHTLTVLVDEMRHTLAVPHGANLRRALLDAGREEAQSAKRKAQNGRAERQSTKGRLRFALCAQTLQRL